MTSRLLDKTLYKSPHAVFKYQWDLTDIKKKPVTILSKMIEFRGEKVFRVGLKNRTSSALLFFMTTNLNKMGLKVVDVCFSFQSAENKKMTPINISKKLKTETIQLFTCPLSSCATGNCIFTFTIYVSGAVEDYEFQQIDCLLKKQLWASVTNQVGTDFELISNNGKRYPVHKFILAARSPVFSALFKGEEAGNSINLNQDAGSIEQFLKFVYTGELEGTIKSYQLMDLATHYHIETLENLCEAALKDIDVDEIASLALQLHDKVEQNAPEIRPGSESGIKFMSNSMELECRWQLDQLHQWVHNQPAEMEESTKSFKFQNEKLFRAQVKTCKSKRYDGYSDFTLTVISYNHFSKMNCKIDEFVCVYSVDNCQIPSTRIKMKELTTSDDKLIKIFTNTDLFRSPFPAPFSIDFHIKLSCITENFTHKFVDSTWGKQLWASALDRNLTDVEFLLEEGSIYAHRPLLSARSPVFAAMFNSGLKEDQTGKVVINDVDISTFRCFLEFLYTGMVASSSINEHLHSLADKYGVETLSNLCFPATQCVDVEDFTTAFLAC